MEASPPPRNNQVVAFQRRQPSSAEPTFGSHAKTAPFQTLSYTPLPHERTPHPPSSRMSSRARSRNSDGAALFKLECASVKEIRAVTAVACAWRGYFVRRALRTQRITEMFRNKSVLRMQCFFRCWKARRERRVRQEAVDATRRRVTMEYNAGRAKEIGPVVQWQRSAFEAAAIKVQRVFRWHRRRVLGTAASDDEPCPLPRRAKVYFPRRAAKRAAASKAATIAASPTSAPSSPGTAVVVVRAPQPPALTRTNAPSRGIAVVPPTEDEVLAANAAMRRRVAHDQYLREQRAYRSEANRHAIAALDMNECASIIQRQYRCYAAKTRRSDRFELRNYREKHAAVIQRAVRSHFARKRHATLIARSRAELRRVVQRYEAEQVARIMAEYTWNRLTMDRAAQTIQRAWRFCTHVRKYAADAEGRPTAAQWAKQGPPAPPYGLLEGTRSPLRPRRAPLPRRHKKREPKRDLEVEKREAEAAEAAKAAERKQREDREAQEALAAAAEARANAEAEEAAAVQRKEDSAAVVLQSALRQQQARREVEEKRASRVPKSAPTAAPTTTTDEPPLADPPADAPVEPVKPTMSTDAAAVTLQSAIRQREARREIEAKRAARAARSNLDAPAA